MNSKVVSIVLVMVAFLGFLDASYLAVEHYRGVIPPCGESGGCEVVTTSEYSVIFGVPVALLGAIYYLVVIFSSFFVLDRKRFDLLGKISLFTVLGFVFSVWFVYIQLFVLRAICIYCMFSALTSTTLFVIGTVHLWGQKNKTINGEN